MGISSLLVLRLKPGMTSTRVRDRRVSRCFCTSGHLLSSHQHGCLDDYQGIDGAILASGILTCLGDVGFVILSWFLPNSLPQIKALTLPQKTQKAVEQPPAYPQLDSHPLAKSAPIKLDLTIEQRSREEFSLGSTISSSSSLALHHKFASLFA